MTNKIEQLTTDHLIDPTRRKLLLGSASAVGVASFLGGSILSVSTGALADNQPASKLLGFKGIAASTADDLVIALVIKPRCLFHGVTPW